MKKQHYTIYYIKDNKKIRIGSFTDRNKADKAFNNYLKNPEFNKYLLGMEIVED